MLETIPASISSPHRPKTAIKDDNDVEKEKDGSEYNNTSESKDGTTLSQPPLLLSHKQKKTKREKEAPEEVSAKHPVSRRRRLFTSSGSSGTLRKPAIGDPRFNPAVAKTAAPRGAYDFLDQYREDEMATLRAQLQNMRDEKKGKGKKGGRKRKGGDDMMGSEELEERKEELKKELARMEAQKMERERRRKAEEVLSEVKKQEQEAVEKGKTPFFLKRGERRRRVQEDKRKRMTPQQIEKTESKRAKKVAAREKKSLPLSRRRVGET